MKLPYLDWIWHVRGRLALQPHQSASQAFGRLEGLFEEKNTSYHVIGDVLTFTKKNQHPQDKMAVFDGGTLRVSQGVLHYEMVSRALLACFVAPLMFFALGHIGVAMYEWRNPPEVVKAKAEASKKRSRVKAENVPMNPIDKFLGAPQPEKKKGGEETGRRNRKPTMTTAYVFMGLFFALWAVGRILEQKLIHARFRKTLMAEAAAPGPWPARDAEYLVAEGASAAR